MASGINNNNSVDSLSRPHSTSCESDLSVPGSRVASKRRRKKIRESSSASSRPVSSGITGFKSEHRLSPVVELTPDQRAQLGPSYSEDGTLRILVNIPWINRITPSPTPSVSSSCGSASSSSMSLPTFHRPDTDTPISPAPVAPTPAAPSLLQPVAHKPKPKRKRKGEQIDPMTLFGENPLIPPRLPSTLPRIPKKSVCTSLFIYTFFPVIYTSHSSSFSIVSFLLLPYYYL